MSNFFLRVHASHLPFSENKTTTTTTTITTNPPPLFFTYQGGRGVAKIGIINAASLDPVGGYNYYRDLFLKYGALEATRIPIDVNHTSANADPKVVSLIRQQTGFFFGGGDQQRIIDT